MADKKEPGKIKKFIKEHKTEIITCTAILTVVAGVLIINKKKPLLNLPKNSTSPVSPNPLPKTTSPTIPNTPKSEEMFHGVPVSELDAIAKECYHGLGVRISKDGYLYFDFKSNRGHQTNSAQMSVGGGKIGPLFGSNSQAIDEFLEKVRERVKFTD